MNRNLLFALCLLTLPLAGWAQNNQPPKLAGSHYPGTPYSFTVAVVNPGAPVTLTAIASTAQSLSKGLLTPADQPIVTLSGTTGTISWSAPQTSRIATKYGRVWVTLLANTTAIGAGWFEFVASNRAVSPSDAVSTIRVTGGISPAELSAVTGPLASSVAANAEAINTRLAISTYTSYTLTQATTNTNVANALATKADANNVYTKTQTDAAKPTILAVTTFAAAQALSVAGKPAIYLITADEKYGLSVTYWNGTAYYSSPLIPRN